MEMLTPDEWNRLLAHEESKRNRMANKRQRWLAIQRWIAWADAQRTGGRNTRARCLQEQERKLAYWRQVGK
jgi:hypothetical protein